MPQSSRNFCGTGSPRCTASAKGARTGTVWVMAVKALGTIAFTVTLWRLSSIDQVRAMAAIPALAAA